MRGVAQRVIDELDSSCTVLRHEALNQRVELDTLIDKPLSHRDTKLQTPTCINPSIHQLIDGWIEIVCEEWFSE